MNDKKWSYSFSWTQPNYGYQWPNPLEQVNAINELARLDFLEEQVQAMTTYPDAEAILKKVMNDSAK